jgi:hypothetical protein
MISLIINAGDNTAMMMILKTIPFKTETSFYETLLDQLGLLKLMKK